MPIDVRVRRATEADVGRILELLEGVAGEDRWIATQLPVDRQRRTSGILATIKRTDAALFVAERDGVVVGELGLYPSWPGVLDLAMLVESAQRGAGIGSALMRAGIEWANSMHAHKISLEVFPWNASAIALYSKYGFLNEGYRRRHLRRANGELWDVISMGLLLGRYDPPEDVFGTIARVRIRAARRADSEELARLRHALWPEASYDDLLTDVHKILDGTASSLPLVDIVAERDNTLIGFVEAGLRSHANHCDPTRPVGFIEGWYVEEASRRCGIGRALIAAAEDWARRQGCQEMASDALIDNTASRIAHEKLGFEVANECTDFWKLL